jgi:hypothetical protein
LNKTIESKAVLLIFINLLEEDNETQLDFGLFWSETWVLTVMQLCFVLSSLRFYLGLHSQIRNLGYKSSLFGGEEGEFF